MGEDLTPNNYVKVTAGRLPVFDGIIPFDDTDLDDTVRAWRAAQAWRDEYPLAVIRFWRRPRNGGPWSGVGLVGEYREQLS